MTDYKEIKECLVCGSAHLTPDVDMGLMPLVNNLKNSQDDPIKTYPLIVNECQECSHKQLSIAVDPKLLFSEYLYQTGTSERHLKFFGDFVHSLGTDRRILDVGCNDGSLLSIFKKYDWECEGVEPAINLVIEATKKGIKVIHDFFPTPWLIHKEFNVITAFNVFAHNDDPKRFLSEMKKLLTPGGSIYILTTPARLDNFYHEHISYFTPKSMITLAANCGMEVSNFKEVSMHGKSYLFEIRNRIEEPRFDESIALLNFPLVGYGASASGVVLINHFGIKLDYVVDDNSLKRGKFIPVESGNIPVVGRAHLEIDKRDLVIVVLAHHLFSDIVAKVRAVRPDRNDIFIHPFKGAIK